MNYLEAVPQVVSLSQVEDKNKELKECQWMSSDDRIFFPSSKTFKQLTPGVYDIIVSNGGNIGFEKIPVITSGLVRFPETNSDLVIEDIQKFWSAEKHYKDFGMIYKRGIILYGPPGSGKSCTVQFILNDVIERNGIVVIFRDPNVFNVGIRIIRNIQKDVPIVVLMEDLDSIISRYCESDVLNILDGVNQIDKVVFLATTNYPENLEERIINRPSRFDKRFLIPVPNLESRKLYLKYILKNNEHSINIDKWAKDTEGFSIAHIKELITSVVILKYSYEDTFKLLNEMVKSKAKNTSNFQMGFK